MIFRPNCVFTLGFLRFLQQATLRIVLRLQASHLANLLDLSAFRFVWDHPASSFICYLKFLNVHHYLSLAPWLNLQSTRVVRVKPESFLLFFTQCICDYFCFKCEQEVNLSFIIFELPFFVTSKHPQETGFFHFHFFV